MADASRRRVTYAQLENLWEFLNRNRAIATGYNKTAQAREFSRRMWENIAQNLNSHGEGAVKDSKGWCKYWNDYKSKLKKLAAAARTSHNQTGGGPSTSKELSEIEKKFLQILGEDFGSGMQGIRVEPFELECVFEPQQVAVEEGVLQSSIVPGVVEDVPSLTRAGALPDSAAPDRDTPTLTATPPAITPRETNTPQRSPRRRRRRQRDVPISQAAARQSLIRQSEQRLNIEERNSEILSSILNVLIEMKDVWTSSVHGHARDVE